MHPAAPPTDLSTRVANIHAMLEQGEFEPAVVQARALATAYATDPSAQMTLSRAEREAGNIDAAYAAALQTISLAPGWWAGHVQLGEAAIDRDEEKTATRSARKALELDPEQADVQLLAGKAAAVEGNLRRAYLHYQRALALRPGHVVAEHLLASLGAIIGPQRRRSYEFLLSRVDQHQIPIELVALSADVVVRKRTFWLGFWVSYASVFYTVIVLGASEGRRFGLATIWMPLLASGVVLLLAAGWFAWLIGPMPARVQRLLLGFGRRDWLTMFAIVGYSVPVLMMLSAPLWWVVGDGEGTVIVVVLALLIPIATDVLVAGVGLQFSATGARELLTGALTRPWSVPLVLGLGLFTFAVRLTIRALRRQSTTSST